MTTTRMSERMRRVNEPVREVVAEAIVELNDPRIGLVTVTGVACRPTSTSDACTSRCSGARRSASARSRRSSRPAASSRRASRRELRMKRTPHLAFEYDPSVERGVRMAKLIDELAPETLG